MDRPPHLRVKPNSEPAKCPHCLRVIFSRRSAKCEWCNEPLPEELLLTEDEKEAIDAELAEMAQDRQERKAKEEEEREKQRRNAASSGMIFTGL